MVTYRESLLLFDKEKSATIDRENVMTTVAHEFTHQWMGNLVSPQWWNYLWLNEGFAAMYENLILDFVFKEERWIDTFITDTVLPVMITDANPSIRPMTFYVESPERVSALFDRIAYSKCKDNLYKLKRFLKIFLILFFTAASVLKTFESALGESVWRNGLKYYLLSRSYNFASPDHLHDSLQQAYDDSKPEKAINVAAAMKSWENQAGLPVVLVYKNYSNFMTIEQKRFFYGNETSDNLWHIPITYYTSMNSTPSMFWFYTRSLSSYLKWKDGNSDWIIINSQLSGYYRVNYDRNLWERLIRVLLSDLSKIHVLNRAQLIDDSFHLARANQSTFDIFLHIFSYLEYETDYIPWAVANQAHNLMRSWFSSSPLYGKFYYLMKTNVKALFNRLGINSISNEPRVDCYARNIAINIACFYQNEDCITLTNAKLKEFVYNNRKIEPDLINSIYCNGMRNADEDLYEKMIEMLMNEPSISERNKISAGIDCIQNPTLYTNFLDHSLNRSNILTSAERERIVSTSPKNSKDFVYVLITWLSNRYRDIRFLSSNMLLKTITNIASQTLSERQYNHFVETIEKMKNESFITEAEMNSYLKKVQGNSQWQIDNKEVLETFFQQYEDETFLTSPTTSSTESSTQYVQSTTEQQGTTTTDGAARSTQSLNCVLFFTLFMKIFNKIYI
jgi:aminopeptidase N